MDWIVFIVAALIVAGCAWWVKQRLVAAYQRGYHAARRELWLQRQRALQAKATALGLSSKEIAS